MRTERPLRYNELEKALKKISSKTLSTKLRNMVNYGIIEKNIIDDAPIKVEYSLTEKGRDLYNAKEHMAAWTERWHINDLIQPD